MSLGRELGLVVLTYRPDDRLLACVSSVRACSVQPSRVLLVDNASPGGYLDDLLEVYPDIEIDRLPTNVGYGAAMNVGARALVGVGCRWIMFMTHETVLAPDAIERLLSRLNADPDIALVGPVLGTLSAPDTVWSAGGRLTRVRLAPRHSYSGRPISALPGKTSQEVAWLDGACLIARASAFEAVGGFREDLFLYCEDVDLARRMQEKSLRVECVLDACALQESSSAPPYLEARNRALVLGRQGAFGVAADIVLRLLADLVRRRSLRRVVLMLIGLRDAGRGRLDRKYAMERPA